VRRPLMRRMELKLGSWVAAPFQFLILLCRACARVSVALPAEAAAVLNEVGAVGLRPVHQKRTWCSPLVPAAASRPCGNRPARFEATRNSKMRRQLTSTFAGDGLMP
jgi:hypothetical protein